MAQIQDLPAELLESILHYLPMQDLLLDQRVSRHWRDVTQSSPQLRRQIFLEFVPADKVADRELCRFVCDNKTPVASIHESSASSEAPSLAGSQASTSSMVHFNPLFPSQGNIIRTRTQQFREEPGSEESWLDMYLTQPPCRFAEATVYYTRSRRFMACGWLGSDTRVCMVQIVRPCGVRARDVLETVRQSPVGNAKKWQRIDIRVPGVQRV